MDKQVDETQHSGQGAKASTQDANEVVLFLFDNEKVLTGAPDKEMHPAKYWKKLEHLVDTIADQDEALTLLQSAHAASGFVEFVRGGILARIRENGWYAPHVTFAEFCEHECVFDVRKAQYLIKIYHFIVEADVPLDQLYDIGWTKLRELINKIEPESLPDWLPKAKDMTGPELLIALKGEGEANDQHVYEKVKMAFNVYPDQFAVIKAALKECKQVADTPHDNQALALICSDFMSGHGVDIKTKALTVKNLCESAVKAHGGDEKAVLMDLVDDLRAIFPEWKFYAEGPNEFEV